MNLNEIAFERLCDAIGEISSRCYCAGWMHDIERELWQAAKALIDFDYGQDIVLHEELIYLLALSERCGGWPEWDDKSPIRRRFVPIAEWRLRQASGR